MKTNCFRSKISFLSHDSYSKNSFARITHFTMIFYQKYCVLGRLDPAYQQINLKQCVFGKRSDVIILKHKFFIRRVGFRVFYNKHIIYVIEILLLYSQKATKLNYCTTLLNKIISSRNLATAPLPLHPQELAPHYPPPCHVSFTQEKETCWSLASRPPPLVRLLLKSFTISSRHQGTKHLPSLPFKPTHHSTTFPSKMAG